MRDGEASAQAKAERMGPMALLVICGLGWGGTVVAGKVSISTGHHPVGLVFWQLAISVAALGLLAAARRKAPPMTAQALVFYAVIALIGTLIPNMASLRASAELPAGVMAIVLSTVPMFSMGVAAALGVERPQARRVAGVGLGLLGVLLILGPEASLPTPEAWPFVILGLAGPLCYGAEGTYVKLRLPEGVDPISALLGASTVGLMLLTPALAAFPPMRVAFPGPFGPAEQAMLISGLLHAGAYAGFVAMVGLGGPVFASMVSYVVTLSGVFWGMLILGERHSVWIWAALAAMVAGMALVQPRR